MGILRDAEGRGGDFDRTHSLGALPQSNGSATTEVPYVT